MDINSINPDIIYITIILIIPLTILIIHNKLKKYNNRKHDKLVGVNINKVLETTVGNMLVESGMFSDKINTAYTSLEFKIREGRQNNSNKRRNKKCLIKLTLCTQKVEEL